jgi:phage shock protein C
VSARHTKFYRDTQNKKLMGVCAGIADYTGVDVTLVRAGTILLTVLGTFMTVIAYYLVGFMAPKKPRELTYDTPEQTKFWQGVRASPARTVRDVRSRFRDIDRRLAEVETYVTSSNSRLAREIEQLR